MRCEACREAISARIDGEDPGVPEEALEAHLAQCPACLPHLLLVAGFVLVPCWPARAACLAGTGAKTRCAPPARGSALNGPIRNGGIRNRW